MEDQEQKEKRLFGLIPIEIDPLMPDDLWELRDQTGKILGLGRGFSLTSLGVSPKILGLKGDKTKENNP